MSFKVLDVHILFVTLAKFNLQATIMILYYHSFLYYFESLMKKIIHTPLIFKRLGYFLIFQNFLCLDFYYHFCFSKNSKKKLPNDIKRSLWTFALSSKTSLTMGNIRRLSNKVNTFLLF